MVHLAIMSEYRSLQKFAEGNSFQLQIQNCAARGLSSISVVRYRFSLEFLFISITDTDFWLKMNEFCNNFGYNSKSNSRFPKIDLGLKAGETLDRGLVY